MACPIIRTLNTWREIIQFSALIQTSALCKFTLDDCRERLLGQYRIIYFYLSCSFGTNQQEFLVSCLIVQLTVFVYSIDPHLHHRLWNRQALPWSQQAAPPVPPCSVNRPDRGGVSVKVLESSSVLNAIHLIHEQTNKAHRQNWRWALFVCSFFNDNSL